MAWSCGSSGLIFSLCFPEAVPENAKMSVCCYHNRIGGEQTSWLLTVSLPPSSHTLKPLALPPPHTHWLPQAPPSAFLLLSKHCVEKLSAQASLIYLLLTHMDNKEALRD